jgi:hypothetical protein
MLREFRACPECVVRKILCTHKTMMDIPSKQTSCYNCAKLHIKCVHMQTPGAAPVQLQAKAAAQPAKAAAQPAKAKPAKAAAQPAPVATKRAQEPAPASSGVTVEEQPDLFDSDVDADFEQELAINREGLRALLAEVSSGEPAPVAAPIPTEGAAESIWPEGVAEGLASGSWVDGFMTSTDDDDDDDDDDEEAGAQERALTEEELDAANDFCSALR